MKTKRGSMMNFLFLMKTHSFTESIQKVSENFWPLLMPLFNALALCVK